MNAVNDVRLSKYRRTNFEVLRNCLGEIPVFSVPFLGENAGKTELIKQGQKKIKKTLAEISDLV